MYIHLPCPPAGILRGPRKVRAREVRVGPYDQKRKPIAATYYLLFFLSMNL